MICPWIPKNRHEHCMYIYWWTRLCGTRKHTQLRMWDDINEDSWCRKPFWGQLIENHKILHHLSFPYPYGCQYKILTKEASFTYFLPKCQSYTFPSTFLLFIFKPTPPLLLIYNPVVNSPYVHSFHCFYLSFVARV